MKRFVWGIVLSVFMVSGAFAAEPDQALLEKAKAEGRVSFYANMTAIAPIMADFEKKYGVKAQYTRLSTTKFIATIMTEHAAGKLEGQRVHPQRLLAHGFVFKFPTMEAALNDLSQKHGN